MQQIQNKIAVITGASDGIGKYVSLALLDRGYHVVLAARRKKALSEVIEQSESGSERGHAIATDVSDPSAVHYLFKEVKNKFGRLDLLFNNAGISLPSTQLENYSYGDWRRVMDINVTGSFLCTQEAFKIMKEQEPMGGRIINNGSLSAHVPRALSAAYTVSKHAITGLTKSASLDGRKYNIACGQIDIGNVQSQMTEQMQQGVMQADGNLAVEPTMPMQRVTDTVLYMAELPLDANVLFLSVMATHMPFVGRG